MSALPTVASSPGTNTANDTASAAPVLPRGVPKGPGAQVGDGFDGPPQAPRAETNQLHLEQEAEGLWRVSRLVGGALLYEATRFVQGALERLAALFDRSRNPA